MRSTKFPRTGSPFRSTSSRCCCKHREPIPLFLTNAQLLPKNQTPRYIVQTPSMAAFAYHQVSTCSAPLVFELFTEIFQCPLWRIHQTILPSSPVQCVSFFKFPHRHWYWKGLLFQEGAGPTLPDGFKHGSLAYYYQVSPLSLNLVHQKNWAPTVTTHHG